MLIRQYRSDGEFVQKTKTTPTIIKLGFVRSSEDGLTEPINEIILKTSTSSKNAIFRSIPILGSILGAARIYSALSTNDVLDEPSEKVWHTIIGVLEILGLGIIILLFKIILTILYYLFSRFIGC
ncbi:hypothetical protein [Candidatus Chlamydia corallus]|uniref:hypothetical protein n=1 Tax=Candidatus Chlamydia corallus TaxID=2038470 RepID=UPI000C2FCE4B|nr:hypothetical protein [Candidatus Chlamydia corallus]